MPIKDRDARLAYYREYGRRQRQEQPTEVRAYHRQYYGNNKEAISVNRQEYQRAYRRTHGRAERLKKYGHTVASWDALFESQNRKCACCGTEQPRPTWHTDHDHKTNEVRGILCHLCNTGIGKLGDTAEGVQRALDYLIRARASQTRS